MSAILTPILATATLLVKLAFLGPAIEPTFTNITASSPGKDFVVQPSGTIIIEPYTEPVIIVLQIDSDGSQYNVKYKDTAKDSLTVSETGGGKHPWVPGGEFTDVKWESKKLTICYSNTISLGLYGIKYSYKPKNGGGGWQDHYYDPAIVNGANTMIKTKCKFPDPLPPRPPAPG